MRFSKLNVRIHILFFGVFFASIFYFLKVESTTQLIVFALTIFLTGVPHGALDLYLDREQKSKTGRIFSNKKFFVKYILNMFLYGVLWYFFPLFALFVFILISAKHFGEIDWAFMPKIQKRFSFFYGLFIISFIITAHTVQTSEIIGYLLPDFPHAFPLIAVGNRIFIVLLIVSTTVFISLLIYLYKNNFENKNLIFFLIQTLVLLLIIYFLPFYLSIAFYFGLWHSILSFDVILQKLKIEKSWIGWKQLIIKALPFSLLAWLGLALIMVLGSKNFGVSSLISMLFVGISILTLPHLQIFSKAIK